MKRLLQTALFLISLSAGAQGLKIVNHPYVSGGFDARNAAIGSGPTGKKPNLDYQIKAGAVSSNIDIGIQYENFPAIDYQQYSAYINYAFPIKKKLLLYAGLETGSIIREGNSNFLFYGGNLEMKYDIAEDFAIGMQGNFKNRPDITYLYDTGKCEFKGSVMVNLYYKFKI